MRLLVDTLTFGAALLLGILGMLAVAELLSDAQALFTGAVIVP